MFRPAPFRFTPLFKSAGILFLLTIFTFTAFAGYSSYSSAASIFGTAPQVTAPGPQSAIEGSSQSFNLGSFIDPDNGPWTVTVAWGDGATSIFPAVVTGSLGTQPHIYSDDGQYTVTVTVTDTLNFSGSNTFQATVGEAVLSLSAGGPINVLVGTTVTNFTVGTFSDPGTNDPPSSFVAIINWGDGVTTPGTLTGAAGNFTVTGTHSYTQKLSGNYSVTVSEGGFSVGPVGNTVTVIAPPLITAAFNPTSILLNGTSTLSVTITNPNTTVALTGLGFGDNLPAGLSVASPAGLTANCGGAAVAATATLSESGGTLAAGASCTVSVNIKGTASGVFTNTTSAIASTNGGSGNPASAVLAVLSTDLAITKTDGVTSAPAGSTVTYIIIVSNAGTADVTGATVVDTLPAAITSAQWTCFPSAGSSCSSAGTGSINQPVNLLAGGTATFTVTAAISPNATGTLSNTATVAAPAVATDPTPANNTATDTDTLTAPSVFVIDDVQKLEGDSGTTPFVFTVTKTGGTGFATAVQFQTQDGTATVADNDYQAASGTLNFGPLDTSKTITILVNGDTNIEPNENFFVRLLPNPANALLFDGGGQGSILNDDPAPSPTPTATPAPTPNRFEGDINRTVVGVGGTGDRDVNVADQIQYLRFLNGTDCPSVGELPRLDAGPRITLGDGSLGALDGVAIDAYARHDASTDADPNTPGWQATPVGGPTVLTNLLCVPSAVPEATDGIATVTAPESAATAAARVVRVVSGSGARNSDITVDIEMTAQGNEAGTQFGLHFDPSALSISSISGVNTNPDIALGAGAPTGTTLNVNADDAANGNIGIVENFNAGAAVITALPEGATRIARVRFHVLDGAASGTSRVDFDTSVINGVTSDVNGMVLSANYEGGDVSVSASRGVTVSGRVTSTDGRGIRGATVTLVNGDGLTKTATTSAFGYYTFDDVAAATYTIGVSSRQYRFGSRTIIVGDNLANVDFTGLE